MPHLPTAPLLLAGSGEFLPVMNEVDREVLQRVATVGRNVAILPTAAGLENPADWIALGQQHFAALGAAAYGVPVYSRADAHDPHWVEALAAAGVIYYSGGRPEYVVETLRDSPVWHATLARFQAGAALAGCSAGSMMLGGLTYNPDAMHAGQPFSPIPALGLLPHWFLIPHFDNAWMFADHSVTDLRRRIPADYTMIGIDEDTALLHTAGAWSVWGEGSVTVWRAGDDPHTYRNGVGAVLLPDPGRHKDSAE